MESKKAETAIEKARSVLNIMTTTETKMTRAQKLTRLARMGQYGHSRKPATFLMTGSYCEFWHSLARLAGIDSFAEYQAVAKLSERFRRFVHYVTEVAPKWRVIETVHYADNSTEVVEESASGQRRQRMTVGPGGDVCF